MNARQFLRGTWAIARSGGSMRLILADLWAGVCWALRGWK